MRLHLGKLVLTMEYSLKLINAISLNLLLISCAPQEEWVRLKTNITDGLHDIEIVNEDVAFTYTYGTGKVFRTTNGGSLWDVIHQFDSIYFEQIQFIDENNGWITGSPNKLFRTKDGGKTWSNHYLKEESSEALIYGMYFQNVKKGYVAALNMNEEGTISNIYCTKNGGEDWELINSINELILNLEEIDNTIYATGNNIIIKDIQEPNKWKYSFRDTLNEVGQIRDIELYDVGKMIASSFNGYILKYNNGIWETHRITENRIRNLVSINNYWLAVGDSNKELNNIYLSKDNGENWSAVEGHFPDIHRIKKFQNVFWAVGKEGLIMTKRLDSSK